MASFRLADLASLARIVCSQTSIIAWKNFEVVMDLLLSVVTKAII
jgi:hypothetical protein